MNVWSSGSWRVEFGVPSLKFQSQLVGLPPDVSRNMTVKGATPLRVDGANVPLPLNAAFGAVPPGTTAAAGRRHAGLDREHRRRGHRDLPPKMFLMPGVIRSNVHDRLTVAESPMSSARAIATRIAEDGGRRRR